nr:hypothetical protein [uncultured Flavobacterium sp.]
MKNLSDHIQESFATKKEEQTVVENLNDDKEEIVNEEKSVEQEKPSE